MTVSGAVSVRDEAHLRAIAKWAREAMLMRSGRSAADLIESNHSDMAFRFCFAKLRWATLALTSTARHELPRDLFAWLRSARLAIRDYRRVDLDKLVELSLTAEQTAITALNLLPRGAATE